MHLPEFHSQGTSSYTINRQVQSTAANVSGSDTSKLFGYMV
jgi:hypothetical protein